MSCCSSGPNDVIDPQRSDDAVGDDTKATQADDTKVTDYDGSFEDDDTTVAVPPPVRRIGSSGRPDYYVYIDENAFARGMRAKYDEKLSSKADTTAAVNPLDVYAGGGDDDDYKQQVYLSVDADTSSTATDEVKLPAALLDSNGDNDDDVVVRMCRIATMLAVDQAFVSPSADDSKRVAAQLATVDEAVRALPEDPKFNERFQEVYDRTPATPIDIRKRAADMTQIADEYTHFTSTVSMAIISGSNAIQPDTTIGGRAGGEKYVVGGVLFKDARDWHNYYGSDIQSARAAKLEVKVYNRLVELENPLVHVTLVSITRYRGRCIVAIAFAPLVELVYGSANAGYTIADGSSMPVVLPLIGELASAMHLRSHVVTEQSTKTTKSMTMALDSEFHRGSDNRLYAVDQARQCPPTPMPKSYRHSGTLLTSKLPYLTNHFHPNFMARCREYGLPLLSSDALSPFAHPSDGAQDKRDINAAYSYLTINVIAELHESLVAIDDMDELVRVLSEKFHEHGVNMRFLPLVVLKCPADSDIRRVLCEEMYIRTLKCLIRGAWNRMNAVSNETLLKLLSDVIARLFGAVAGDKDDDVVELMWWCVSTKYCDNAQVVNELHEDMVAVMTRQQTTMTRRLLDALEVSYDDDDVNTYESWTLRSEVVMVKTPKFVPLSVREQHLRHECEFLKQAGLPIIAPLTRLLQLYELWRDEEPEQTLAKGTAVADELLAIVATARMDGKKVESTLLYQCGVVFVRVNRFFKHFGKFTRARAAIEEGVEIFRHMMEMGVTVNVAGYHIRNDLGVALSELARVCDSEGKYNDAIEYYTQSLRIFGGDEHSDQLAIATTRSHMGEVFWKLSRYEQALKEFEESMRLRIPLLGPQHEEIGRITNNIGLVYHAWGRYNEALERYSEALKIYVASVGPDSIDVARTRGNIGGAYDALNRREEALAEYEESLRVKYSLFGHIDHPSIATSLNKIGTVHEAEGRYDEALQKYNEDLDMVMRLLGDSHPDVASSMRAIGGVYQRQGRYDEALQQYERCLQIKLAAFGEMHEEIATTYNDMGVVYTEMQDMEKAITHYENCLRIYIELLGTDHPFVATTNMNIGSLYWQRSDPERAILHWREAKRIWTLRLPPDHPSMNSVNDAIALYYDGVDG